MVEHIQDYGRVIRCMEKALSFGLMGEGMWGSM
jgi:hypothetical protein